jgi:hypothetical protein
MLTVKNIHNRYTSFTLNLTNYCSWWLNGLAFRFNAELLCRSCLSAAWFFHFFVVHIYVFVAPHLYFLKLSITLLTLYIRTQLISFHNRCLKVLNCFFYNDYKIWTPTNVECVWLAKLSPVTKSLIFIISGTSLPGLTSSTTTYVYRRVGVF